MRAWEYQKDLAVLLFEDQTVECYMPGIGFVVDSLQTTFVYNQIETGLWKQIELHEMHEPCVALYVTHLMEVV